ncbi:MAG: hypothetical protein JXA04_01360 [Gammaproteobacteria bacterium]|nr:hypothetical protein [Gammaproteobacteria bacterium]
MAIIRYTGDAEAVAQVDKFTPANVEIGDIFTLTVTGMDGRTVSISYTAEAATVADVTAGLTEAWNNSTDALCSGITAEDVSSSYVTLTANIPGTAFYVTASAVNGGSTDDQTLTKASVTANSGPHDASCADNWSGGAVPGGASGQEVFIENATILYGLDMSGISNALSSLTTSNSQVGQNPAAGFLPVYFQIKASIINIGLHTGPGSVTHTTPINIDAGSTATEIIVYDSGSNSDSSQPAVRLLANNSSTNIAVKKGKVGIAFDNDDTATVGNITINYISNVSTDADVYIGTGVTFNNLIQKGGDCICRSSIVTACAMTAGTLKTYGTGTIASIDVRGGSAELNSTGTITNLVVRGTGIIDFTKSSAARTVTTPKIDPSGTIKFDPSIVNFTDKLVPYTSEGNITLQAA